jgi:N-acetylmuramoyl-L-alanine amidase
MDRNGLDTKGWVGGFALALGLFVAPFAQDRALAGGLVGARSAAKAYSGGPAATDANVERSPGAARIVLDLNLPVTARAFVLSEPDRVIVDLPEIGFLLSPSAGRLPPPARGAQPDLVSSFRFGQFAPGRSRIVVELAGPARIVKAQSEPTPSGGASRLVLELAATDPDSFRAAAHAARQEQLQAAPAAPHELAPVVAPAGLPVVALDAGHGGVDIGAIGGKDAHEKAIVLDFARVLAAKIERGGKAKALLTRRDDAFVPLAERVKVAREGGASLFISIHADTLNETSVHGATVYTLSDRASDAEAARLAAKENSADRAGGLADAEETIDVNDILFDLTRRETRAMSHAFAQGLVAEWKSAGDLNKNPVRSAGFVVLKAPDVPSVLLELGYLSSTKDLSKLTSPEWRDQAAGKVALAIERYFAGPQRNSESRTASADKVVAAGAAGR